MSTIVTRAGKGSPLTNTEVDTNFTNLNTDKIQSGDTVATLDINGGSIDGVTLGTNSPVTEADIDNININGNTISSTNTDGNIALTPNGTGEVDISKVDIDSGTIDNTAIGGSTAAAGSFTTLNTSGAVVFNDAGADVDFRVEGDTDANLLFVDASTDRVGIGTTSPGAKLQVGTRSSSLNSDNSTVFTAGAASASGGIADVASFANTVAAANGNEARITFTPASDYSATAAIGAAIQNTLNAQTALKFYTYDTGPLTERMRITSDGYLRLAGAGIQFNGDTAAANALDDYEEGTWTPVLGFASQTGSLTYTIQNGAYTKVGNLVCISLFLAWSANTITSPSGSLRLSGLPFTINGTQSYRGGAAIAYSTTPWTGITVYQSAFRTEANQSVLNFNYSDTTDGSIDTEVTSAAAITGSGNFMLTLNYFT